MSQKIYKAPAWYFGGEAYSTKEAAIEARLRLFISETLGIHNEEQKTAARFIRENFEAIRQIMASAEEQPTKSQ